VWAGDEAGVDDGETGLAEEGDQAFILWDCEARIWHFHGSALAHEVVL
jgi:hypothetical protein